MDHPSNTKRGGVCLYYKFLLPLKVIEVSYLQEYINLRLKLATKHETLPVSIHLLAKQKMNLRISLKI